MSTKTTRQAFDEALANMISNPKYANDYLLYAHMVGMCSVEFNDKVKVAGVKFDIDHYVLAINPEDFDAMTLEQRLAVIKHEMLHILNNHVMRKENRDDQKWGMATDCSVNQEINPAHLPEGAILPENLPVLEGETAHPKMASEQYYGIIDDSECDEQSECPQGQPQAGEGEGQGGEGEEGEGDGEGQGQGSGNGQGMDDHGMWDESQGDPDLMRDLTRTMIERSIASTQKSIGNIPQGIMDYLAMFTRKAEVSWKQVLRNIVGNKRTAARRTIMRSDRRFPKRDDLRGKTKDRTFNLLVVSDVSGSVSDEAATSLWSEIRHVCDVTKTAVDLIQVDTRPCPPEKLTKTTSVINRKACGGTNLNPALDTAKEHNIDFQAIVVTTDGYLSESDVSAFAKCGKRVIWLIEKNGQIMDSMNSGKMQAVKLKQ